MPGSETFRASADAYDRFVGRYGPQLASALIDFAGVQAGMRALDVGCGPGALAAALQERLGSSKVHGAEPSEPFAEACRSRLPNVEVVIASAESPRWVDAQVARRVLYADCDENDAREAYERLRPQAQTPHTQPCPLETLPAVEQAYVVCSEDRIVNPEWARRVASERLDGELVELSATTLRSYRVPEKLRRSLTGGQGVGRTRRERWSRYCCMIRASLRGTNRAPATREGPAKQGLFFALDRSRPSPWYHGGTKRRLRIPVAVLTRSPMWSELPTLSAVSRATRYASQARASAV